MTTITEKMIKSGTLHSTEAEAQIYQDGSEFFYQVSGWTIDDDGERDYFSESRRYPSLEDLLSDLPVGIHYQAEGTEETTQELVERFLDTVSQVDYTAEFKRIDEERMAKYGTTDYLKITEMLKARNENA